MALSDLIRDGLALADSVTSDLQPAVSHEAWTGNTGLGGHTYAAAVSRPALIERKDRLIRTPEGSEIQARHLISFLRPIAANGAPGRDEPIDPRDRITLPDGSTGPIVAVEGFVDRQTGANYFHQVWLGSAS